MTNKSGLTFFLSIKYLSACLYTIIFFYENYCYVFTHMKVKNSVQALKYPSADAVTLYMLGFKAINWK